MDNIARFLDQHPGTMYLYADDAIVIYSLYTTRDGHEGYIADVVRTYAEARIVMGY